MANPKLAACATELAEDFCRNWARKVPDLGAGTEEPAPQLVAAVLYSLLYSGRILCPKPEHRIGISLRQETIEIIPLEPKNLGRRS